MSAIEIKPFPTDFPNKGKYRRYTSSWQRDGYADGPQYPGQMPINFPEDATPFECALGGYITKRREQ